MKKHLTLNRIILLILVLLSSYFLWRYLLLGWLGFFNGMISYITALLLGIVAAYPLLFLISTSIEIFSGMVKGKDKDKNEEGVGGALVVALVLGLLFVLIVGGIITGIGWWLDASFGGQIAMTKQITPICEQANGSPTPLTDPLGKVWVVGENLKPQRVGLHQADSLEDLDTVICIESRKKEIEACKYEGATKLRRYLREWEVTVLDWDTKRVRTRRTFLGSTPSCPGFISSERTSAINGGAPSDSSIQEWLASIDE